MTSSETRDPFRIEKVPFTPSTVAVLKRGVDPKHVDWPVVYTLADSREIYVGESLNVGNRLGQHLETAGRRHLGTARIVIGEDFNKSVCLDLESMLIKWFAGDGRFTPLNRNAGVVDADYFDRARYRETFEDIFEQLRAEGLFSKSIAEIQNSDLFKLSPFKALNADQSAIVEAILDQIFDDIEAERPARMVIQGEPGTGKTVVAIYLLKVLADIRASDNTLAHEEHSPLAEFFVPGHAELLTDFRVGLVIPQQSLRASVRQVFRKTPGLDPKVVLSPFEAVTYARKHGPFDLLVVDEAHRLNQRAPQAAGPLNGMFRDNNVHLFGHDDAEYTQFDWINKISTHQLYLVDGAQAVRPADVAPETLNAVVEGARVDRRLYRLSSQMRVAAGQDYVGYIRQVLAGEPIEPQQFPGYDLRFFDDLGAMHDAIRERDAEHGLARLLAGYCWSWASKNDKSAIDIELDGQRLQWNQAPTDWVHSPGSLEQVGSIHTIQGYDLNVAGVVIGPDLYFDPAAGRVVFDRNAYKDPRGMTSNRQRGITYTDDDIAVFVRNIYAVLLTRGMLGTYVYVCDPALREYLRPHFVNTLS
ncbi:DNA/RNA helicase domain-containing protein [Nocardioides dubius]|uniref:GIY-YIG domain-containing protein n=1 Tax=Nocardioides dubius TaxID=317019 RepID=A0ABN1TYS1_9ACTN